MKALFRTAMVGLLFLGADIRAQQPSDTAVKLAELTMQTQGDRMKAMVASLRPELLAQVRANGASETASRVFGETFEASFNGPNITQVLAIGLRSSLSEAELRETLTFFESNTGRRYMAIAQGNSAMQSAVQAILRQTCKTAEMRLTGPDRDSLRGTCRS